jgi:hypothetical protein
MLVTGGDRRQLRAVIYVGTIAVTEDWRLIDLKEIDRSFGGYEIIAAVGLKFPMFWYVKSSSPLKAKGHIVLYSRIQNSTNNFLNILQSYKLRKKGSYPCKRPWRPIWLWDVEDPAFPWQSAHRWRWICQPFALAALYTRENLWYSYLLEAELIPAQYCCWKD